MQLPFPDGAFDAVVCQFGVMFFPEKSKAFSEARRVLRPGGVFVFNVWDRIEDNEFADTVTTALDHCSIGRDLANGGFIASPGLTRLRRAVGRHHPGSRQSRTVRGHR
jgi:SAM-dependent methyltransferase